MQKIVLSYTVTVENDTLPAVVLLRSLRHFSVYHYDGAQQFLRASRLERTLILLSLALYLLSASVSSVLCGAAYILNFFEVTFFTLCFSELSLVGLTLDFTTAFSAMKLLVGSSDP